MATRAARVILANHMYQSDSDFLFVSSNFYATGQVFFGDTWQCAGVEASKAFLEKCVPATLPQVCVQRGESLHLNLTREGSCFDEGVNSIDICATVEAVFIAPICPCK